MARVRGIVLPDVERCDGAFQFLVGSILNQNISGRQAWAGVERLAERGMSSPELVRASGRDGVLAVVRQTPSVHPFAGTMAEALYAVAADVVDLYEGDARQVWRVASSRAELMRRLVAFRQIGAHKADVAICMLAEVYGVVPREWGSVDRMAVVCPTVLDMLSSERWTVSAALGET